MSDFDPAAFAVWYIVFLLTITAHEAAHALAALWGGDDTAYRGGQVTLNPVPHIRREPFGMVLAPILTFLWAGWTLGWASTPYNPFWAKSHPRGAAAMAAAGPAANLLIALAALILLKALVAFGVLMDPGPAARTLSELMTPTAAMEGSFWAQPLALILSVFLSLNYILLVFNLIPIPPLDGGAILQNLFPDSVGRLFAWLYREPMFSILGILVAWKVYDAIDRPALRILIGLLY